MYTMCNKHTLTLEKYICWQQFLPIDFKNKSFTKYIEINMDNNIDTSNY